MPAARAPPKVAKGKNDKDVLTMVTNLRSDMSEDMQREAINSAIEAFNESKDQKEIAAVIKKRFDATYAGSTWHVIVGNHFASSVSHAAHCLCFFTMQGQTVLLFRSLE